MVGITSKRTFVSSRSYETRITSLPRLSLCTLEAWKYGCYCLTTIS